MNCDAQPRCLSSAIHLDHRDSGTARRTTRRERQHPRHTAEAKTLTLQVVDCLVSDDDQQAEANRDQERGQREQPAVVVLMPQIRFHVIEHGLHFTVLRVRKGG
jgi:hypothetical protein